MDKNVYIKYYIILYIMYCLRLLHDNHRPYIHPAGTMRESLFIHTAGGIAIQDYVPGLF